MPPPGGLWNQLITAMLDIIIHYAVFKLIRTRKRTSKWTRKWTWTWTRTRTRRNSPYGAVWIAYDVLPYTCSTPSLTKQ
jgi:hypothetical protein